MKYFPVVLLLFILWVYLLTVFKRKKLDFLYFILGCVGLFTFSFFILEPIATAPLAKFVCYCTGIVGKMLGAFEAYASYGVLFIENANGPVSLYVDFECAGLVEILVFIALIAFFGVYKGVEKIVVAFLGSLWIIGCNIFRLTIICYVIHWFGNESYYMAHTIIGRIVFYALSILLYFYVFTRKQIRNQKVGDFQYDGKID